MKLSSRFLSILLLVALGHGGLLSGGEKDKSPAQPGSAGDSAVQGLGAFGKGLPVGTTNKDVKNTSFEDGVPSSLVRAAAMTRMDDNLMQMEKMDIRMFDRLRQNDLRVQLITAIYDMATQILTSKERSRISREDFQLEGDSLIFDTRTQQGKMQGNVHMIIFDSATLNKKPGEPADGKSSQAKKTDAAKPAGGDTTEKKK